MKGHLYVLINPLSSFTVHFLCLYIFYPFLHYTFKPNLTSALNAVIEHLSTHVCNIFSIRLHSVQRRGLWRDVSCEHSNRRRLCGIYLRVPGQLQFLRGDVEAGGADLLAGKPVQSRSRTRHPTEGNLLVPKGPNKDCYYSNLGKKNHTYFLSGDSKKIVKILQLSLKV